MAEQYDEREARKRYVRHRQRIVFSIVGAAMVAALVVSFLFYFHIFGLGEIESTDSEPNYGITAPCSVADDDGNAATTVDNRTISIRVLNGTGQSGFALAVYEALENRNFKMQSYDNYSSTNVERTTIYFGINAINEAYTLNNNFNDAIMVMDDREDTLIDVVIGATFDDLVDTTDVPATGSPIEDFSNCVAASDMTDLPAAIDH